MTDHLLLGNKWIHFDKISDVVVFEDLAGTVTHCVIRFEGGETTVYGRVARAFVEYRKQYLVV